MISSLFNHSLPKHLSDTSCMFYTFVAIQQLVLKPITASLQLASLQHIVTGTCYDFKQLSQLLTVVSSKVRDQTEPRRVQVLDFYCLTRVESENSRRESCLLKTS